MTGPDELDAAEVTRMLTTFAGRRALVIGDVMLDRTVTGTVDRLSPEAPVPVLRGREETTGLGGAANVARQLVAFGAAVHLVGVVGDDPSGAEVSAHCQERGIDATLVVDGSRPTTQKARFIAQRHLLRVDQESTDAVGPAIERALIRAIAERDAPDLIVVTDHAKGVLTPEVAACVAEHARTWGVPVLVDPKSSPVARGCGATVVKANQWEWEELSGVPIGADPLATVRQHAAAAFDATGCSGLVVTLAGAGMVVATAPGEAVRVPASAVHAVEVSGAGDTVIAALALGLASGLDLVGAARLANHAAGLAVALPGVAVVELDHLTATLGRAAPARTTPGEPPAEVVVGSTEELLERVAGWRAAGRSVVFTNGCFDLLHVGHVSLLEAAAAEGDVLVVALDTDASVRHNKGPTRPIVPAADRAELVAALTVVDAVVLFSHDELELLVKRVDPDVLVKGADYQLDQIVGATHVLAAGGRVVRAPLRAGSSTTSVVETIRSGPAPSP